MADRRGLALAALLVVLLLAAWYPVLTADFVSLDDDRYVYDNPHLSEGFSRPALVWALSAGLGQDSPHAEYWQPVTLCSRLLDWRLFGEAAGGHHAVNLFLHLCNTLFVFLLLRRATGKTGPSFFVAALFGLHPLQVEAVAWVTARKDTLSAFFGLVSLAAYGRYARRGSRLAFAAAFLAATAAMLAKPLLVVLPALFLIVDYWPLERDSEISRPDSPLTLPSPPRKNARGRGERDKPPIFRHVTRPRQWARLLGEKTLLVAPALLAAAAVLSARRHVEDLVTVSDHVCMAIRMPVVYLGRFLAPVHLAVQYPPPAFPLPFSLVLLAGGFLLAASFALARPSVPRAARAGWLWYLVTLLPVAGLADTDGADRFTYLPLLGLGVMLAWGVPAIRPAGAGRARVNQLLAAATLIACFLLTAHQVRFWQGSMSLYEHSLAVAGGHWPIQTNYANELARRGRWDEAVTHYMRALSARPRDPTINGNLAVALEKLGRFEEATARRRITIESDGP